MRVRREVLGDDHVDRATAATTDLDADFQRYITETAWGSVWTSDDQLDRRTRSCITIALLTAFATRTSWRCTSAPASATASPRRRSPR